MLLPAGHVAAQGHDGNIVGLVKERSSGLPVEFATVTLHEAATRKTATGCITDSTGHFHLERIAAGKYYVECSMVGCKPVTSATFTLDKGRTADIGTLIYNRG